MEADDALHEGLWTRRAPGHVHVHGDDAVDSLKDGVGIVLDAGSRVELGGVTIVTDDPGFTARIQAGNRSGGPFEDVSEDATIGERTTIELDTGGRSFRYYVVWITSLDGSAHLNEIRAG